VISAGYDIYILNPLFFADEQFGCYNHYLVKTAIPSAAQMEAFGRSEVFLDFQQQIARAAKVQRPVLLIGERGTGKELAAARVHYLSPRWGGPFIKLNCAALSPTVLESELFGHEAGAFTGAMRRRSGRFEAAHGGTLFLDEIGQMPLIVQEKILRAVEYGSFERVGSSEPVTVDVRLVGATHADLPAMAAEGRFKPDLLDRLSFEVLCAPALRERGPEDVDLLTSHFAGRMAAELRLESPPEFSEAARTALRDHPWPGNVRELKNVVERAVSRAEGAVIREIIFDPFRRPPEKNPSPAPPLADGSLPVDLPGAVADLERRFLRQALSRTRHRQREAAALLGLSYDQFRSLYRKHQSALNGEDGAKNLKSGVSPKPSPDI
jgi:psp operon transcriptional activator